MREHQARVIVPTDAALPVLTAAAPVAGREFAVVDACRTGDDDWDPLLQCTVLSGPPKRYAFPGAIVTADPVPGRLDAVRLRADKPAFFVTPDIDGVAGAFDDASVLLLPGEDRVLTFRHYKSQASLPIRKTEVHGLGIRVFKATGALA